MTENTNGKKKRKGLIAILVILIVVAILALAAFLWFQHKLSLIRHEEVNKEELFTAGDTTGAKEKTPVKEEKTETTTETKTEEYNLSGVEVIALTGVDTREEFGGANSDTMILCCIDHNQKQLRLVSLYRDTLLNVGSGGGEYYTKANAAYNSGGPTQYLSMLNRNLDLNITDYITVDFKALVKTIDLLGGLDIDMTKQEVGHANNYAQEVSRVVGTEYQPIEIPDDPQFDGLRTRTFHVNGTQATSYARIRYTDGWDMRRTARQRLVISKIFEKIKEAGIGTINTILEEVLPMVTTSYSGTQLLSLIKPLLTYQMDPAGQKGFPFAYLSGSSVTATDCLVPVTLEYNVVVLHQFLFPGVPYTPSETMLDCNDGIIRRTGYDEKYIESACQMDDGTIPIWNEALGGLENADHFLNHYVTPQEFTPARVHNFPYDLIGGGSATVTPTPTPIVTPEVTVTPTEAPQPQPTETPEPQPTGTPEPQPTETPEPQPTETPEPQPTEVPQPQPTGEPQAENAA